MPWRLEISRDGVTHRSYITELRQEPRQCPARRKQQPIQKLLKYDPLVWDPCQISRKKLWILGFQFIECRLCID
jgi:hypothetical protein